jgi:hypothetical protein
MWRESAKPSAVLVDKGFDYAPGLVENSIVFKVFGNVTKLWKGQTQYLPPS